MCTISVHWKENVRNCNLMHGSRVKCYNFKIRKAEKESVNINRAFFEPKYFRTSDTGGLAI